MLVCNLRDYCCVVECSCIHFKCTVCYSGVTLKRFICVLDKIHAWCR
nr:MAG TPA: hypothetical protein [Caudoviricetes sp.]